LFIARLIADPDSYSASVDAMRATLSELAMRLTHAETLSTDDGVLHLELSGGDAVTLRRLLDRYFPGSDAIVAEREIRVPQLFVSDMDSTMIGQECIDELADFAGLKPQIAVITERAMQGELDFESALRERVMLLRDLSEDTIQQCLKTRIEPMPGGRTLVESLKALGCRTVLVTGGFHHFADPVAEQLGFERVVGNRLEVANGRVTGGLVGAITDSGVKKAVLLDEARELGADVVTMATGDGANDIPMLEAATYGIAYRAKPKARAAANGWVERGDLTSILRLLGVAQAKWTAN
jgi:phosphoserine phosphatase